LTVEIKKGLGENGDRRDGRNDLMPENVREELLEMIGNEVK